MIEKAKTSHKYMGKGSLCQVAVRENSWILCHSVKRSKPMARKQSKEIPLGKRCEEPGGEVKTGWKRMCKSNNSLGEWAICKSEMRQIWNEEELTFSGNVKWGLRTIYFCRWSSKRLMDGHHSFGNAKSSAYLHFCDGWASWMQDATIHRCTSQAVEGLRAVRGFRLDRLVHLVT